MDGLPMHRKVMIGLLVGMPIIGLAVLVQTFTNVEEDCVALAHSRTTPRCRARYRCCFCYVPLSTASVAVGVLPPSSQDEGDEGVRWMRARPADDQSQAVPQPIGEGFGRLSWGNSNAGMLIVFFLGGRSSRKALSNPFGQGHLLAHSILILMTSQSGNTQVP